MAEKIVDKCLSIAGKVTRMDKGSKRKAPSITITFSYASYLNCARKDAERLIDGLMHQALNFSSGVPIRGLELRWTEYTDEMP